MLAVASRLEQHRCRWGMLAVASIPSTGVRASDQSRGRTVSSIDSVEEVTSVLLSASSESQLTGLLLCLDAALLVLGAPSSAVPLPALPPALPPAAFSNSHSLLVTGSARPASPQPGHHSVDAYLTNAGWLKSACSVDLAGAELVVLLHRASDSRVQCQAAHG